MVLFTVACTYILSVLQRALFKDPVVTVNAITEALPAPAELVSIILV